MIGLAFSAASTIMSLVGANMKDEEVVTKTKMYTPNTSTFQQAGLYNNAVADIGEQTISTTTQEQSGTKKGLMMGGTVLGAASPLIAGAVNKSKLGKEEAA